MQADLIDFSSLKQYNDNFKYILVVIDVFFKNDFISFLKAKTSSKVIRAFEEVLPKIGRFQNSRLIWGVNSSIDHFKPG